jgi:hypothetical protein
MLPAGNLDEVDGRNYHPKHVELIGIINKPLLLHVVGRLYYCIIILAYVGVTLGGQGGK